MKRLLNISQVTEIIGKSRVTIHRWIRDGHFPAPRRLGKRAIAWTEESIIEWIETRPSSR